MYGIITKTGMVDTKMDKQLVNVMKQIDKNGFAIVRDGKLARELSKKPMIKRMRDDDTLIIGNDRRKNMTIFFKKPVF